MAEEPQNQENAKESPPIVVPERLREPFGLPEQMNGPEFDEAMASIRERKYGEIPIVNALTNDLAMSYRQMLLNPPPVAEDPKEQKALEEKQAEIRERQLKLLEEEVRIAIEFAQTDPNTKKMLVENPRYKDFELNPDDAAKVTALIASEMEQQADLIRGQQVADERARREQRQGENVAANAEISPPKNLPKGKGADQTLAV